MSPSGVVQERTAALINNYVFRRIPRLLCVGWKLVGIVTAESTLELTGVVIRTTESQWVDFESRATVSNRGLGKLVRSLYVALIHTAV